MSWQKIVKENNLDVSIIRLTDLSLAKVIGAEYYKKDFIVKDDNLHFKKALRFKDLVSSPITKGETPLWQGYDYQKEGVPFIRSQNLFSSGVKGELVYVEEEYNQKKKRSIIKYGDSLIAIVGATIGKVGFYDLEIEANCNQAVAVVRTNNELCYYVNTFLQSSYFSFQLEREKSGNARDNIGLDQIRDFFIVTPTKTLLRSIKEVVLEAHSNKKKSELLYAEAEQIFLKEIGLKNHIPSKEKISVRDLLECLKDDRFDAEYWQPEYDAMEKAVSKVAQKELGEIVSMSKGIEVGSEAYDPEGKPFIRVSDFSIYGTEDVEKKISPKLYDELKDKYTPKKGEVLFTKDGTIGLSYALHEDTVGVLSSAFLRLKPTIRINTDYLALALNSLYCKTQIERMSGGAIIAHLKPESAKKIKIPLLSDVEQAEIAEKISTAFRMRKEAKELLEKAKRSVEIFIEKDESEALKYLAL